MLFTKILIDIIPCLSVLPYTTVDCYKSALISKYKVIAVYSNRVMVMQLMGIL